MNTSIFKGRRHVHPLAVALALAAPLLLNSQGILAAVGIVCSNSNNNITLTTQTGYITTSDANTLFSWGFSLDGQSFQYPGPTLCVNEGDTVTVTLNNSFAEDVSIMFPGQDNVLANGLTAQPQFDATGKLVSMTNAAPKNGGSVTYTFTANRPGTFVYESGTEPRKQVRLGLFGALVVRPALGADHLNNRADSKFTTPANSSLGTTNDPEDYMVLLSELDPYLNQAAENGSTAGFDFTSYHPRYWMINGRGFPDSIADNDAPFLPGQPYGALARTQPKTNGPTHPFPGAIRYLNVGTEDFPFHPHGNNGLVVARDGNPLENSTGADLSMEKFVVEVGPGQTYDVLFSWHDAENYSAGNPPPMTQPTFANINYGSFYSGSPYLGVKGASAPGASSLNECGEFYVISHNHNLDQLDAWGLTMAGPITWMRVDKTGGC
jgi:FtsP/CotA-like multicopper oxidase with cupredoxin domain